MLLNEFLQFSFYGCKLFTQLYGAITFIQAPFEHRRISNLNSTKSNQMFDSRHSHLMNRLILRVDWNLAIFEVGVNSPLLIFGLLFVQVLNRHIWDKVFKNVPSEICLSNLYYFKFCKGCLPQSSFSPFLNTLSHLFVHASCIFSWLALLPQQ